MLNDTPQSTPDCPPSTGRFVWPPRDAATGTQPGATELGHPLTDAAPPANPQPLSGALFSALPPRRWAKFHGILREIETVWLGQTRSPLADRAADEGWKPDAPADYCPRCGISIGTSEALDPDALAQGVPQEEAGCPSCRGERWPWHRFIRLGEHDGLLRQVVHEIKFTRWRRLGYEAGLLLGRQVQQAIASQGSDETRIMWVPVPTSFWRRTTRGIDHALTICRGACRAAGGTIVPALSRSHRPTQVGTSLSRRRQNVAGSMRPRRASGTFDCSACTVVVVDDVKTTGATLREACRALRLAVRTPIRQDRLWAAALSVAALDRSASP